jgi:hypothetical protein
VTAYGSSQVTACDSSQVTIPEAWGTTLPPTVVDMAVLIDRRGGKLVITTACEAEVRHA